MNSTFNAADLSAMEHLPILPPGLHELAESDIDNHFASNFPDSTTRLPLIAGLRSFFIALKQMEIAFEIWIDGSFTTNKTNPNDIDLVAFADASLCNQLETEKQQTLIRLFDREETRRVYGLDVLFCPAEDPNGRSYWRGWYGFDRHENPKGIAKVIVEP
jgi:hypothetical protein